MVKKKVKLSKSSRSKGNWLKEDVPVNTSLPPQVDGQLRCYLKLCVNQIIWNIPSSPDVAHVRVQWWGEESEGALFRPVDVKRSDKSTAKTSARYPIRSGPKQFAAYLSDLSTLVFEVLSGEMQVPVGRVMVDKIGHLNPSRPINGFFPVISPSNEKIAELQISIALESLMASYDSTMSSVPTPDMSVDFYQQAVTSQLQQPVATAPAPQPMPLTYAPADDTFKSPTNARSQQPKTKIDTRTFRAPNPLRESNQSLTSRSKTSATSQPASSKHDTTPPPYPSSSGPYPSSSSKPSAAPMQSLGFPTPAGAVLRHHQQGQASDSQGTLRGLSTLETPLTSVKSSREVLGAFNPVPQPNGNDLVSVLLERGAKLKRAMIKSTLDIPATRSDVALPDVNTFGTVFSPLKKDGSTANIYSDVMREAATMPGRVSTAGMGVAESFASDLDERALDMVLGAEVANQQYKLMKALEGSPASSLSVDDALSDVNDPLHDDTILNELFYRNVSDGSDLELELYTGGDHTSRLDDVTMRTDDVSASRKSRSRHRRVVNASLEDSGNIRMSSRGSRCSSMSSVILNLDEPETDVSQSKSRKVKGKKKQRSRSASADQRDAKTPKKKPEVKRRSRSGSVDSKNKTGVKRKSKSRSRSRDLRASHSDGELMTSVDSTAPKDERKKKGGVDGMSVQRLTLLGRVHVARVLIERLNLVFGDAQSDVTTTSGKTKRKSLRQPTDRTTYFVEYNFPVTSADKTRDKYTPSALATEVTRVASKNVNGACVTFTHRSVFPVLFDADAVEKWWKSVLIFKLYSRRPQQKVPSLLGTCSLSLRSVLTSEALYVERAMDVKDRSRAAAVGDQSLNSSQLDDRCPLIGQLKVTVELASDNKDFNTALAKTRLAEMTHPLKIVPIVPRAKPPKPDVMTSALDRQPLLTSTLERPPTLADETTHLPPPSPRHTRRSPSPRGTRNSRSVNPPPETPEAMTLHTLVMIAQGQLSNGGQGQAGATLTRRSNAYVRCRMFWCDDAATSGVCWGSNEPQFSFQQVAPVLLTPSLLARMRDNVLVVEVWDKQTSPGADRLLGIVKLPLHQFYMSFRDRQVARSLLKSEYPVISVDGHMQIVNPFDGLAQGELQVLLAMGSREQVASLQNTKLGLASGYQHPDRPTHYLERQDVYSGRVGALPDVLREHVVEHVFEFSVLAIKGLRLQENMIWGEADCFVQYHFPAQSRLKQQGAPDIMHAVPSLKAYRTATTLCVPDPVFNDVTRHKLSLAESRPVQQELLASCAGAGGGAGGVPFEVWCRFYSPNVREAVMARTQLPLARLCAMVTMHKPGEASTQVFSLPLHDVINTEQVPATEQQVSGAADSQMLQVHVNYSRRTLEARTDVTPSASRSVTSSTVNISVGVVRACGLQAAASALAQHDTALGHVALVGVNTYARVRLSFLGRDDERMTRTVARSFTPDFNYYIDFPVPLLWSDPVGGVRAGSDAVSLAELLASGELQVELWHQSPPSSSADHTARKTMSGSDEVTGTARRLVPTGDDVMLGCVNVSLMELLDRKTGVNGWQPLYVPTVGWDTGTIETLRTDSGRTNTLGVERVVGGVELSIKFAHSDDLHRVLTTALSVGWQHDVTDTVTSENEDDDDVMEQQYSVTVSLDAVTLPLDNALIAGESRLDPSTRCYIRYKFYDKGARCSRLCELEADADERFLTADVIYSKTLSVIASAPLKWYLREERLELQVWLTRHPEPGDRPRNRDKLIGSAYIALTPLAQVLRRRRSHRVSGLQPLFKPGSPHLAGAHVRAHVSIKPTSGVVSDSDESAGEYQAETSESRKLTSEQRANSFGVHISIERAFHLPVVTERDVSTPPSAYVTYQTAERRDLTYTSVFPRTSNPIWSYQHDTRLPRAMLTQGAKDLVFKVWHKSSTGTRPSKASDKVLGFVSVDLAPLTTGFNSLCGWYNVIDFNGLCQGQIKVSITPLEPLVALEPTVPLHKPLEGVGGGARFAQFLQTTKMATPLLHHTVPHYNQHYASVKRHHEQLNQHMTQTGQTDPSQASRSLLFNSLRHQMNDLDKITATLRQRLTVTSPAVFDTKYSDTDRLNAPLTDTGQTAFTDQLQYFGDTAQEYLDGSFQDQQYTDDVYQREQYLYDTNQTDPDQYLYDAHQRLQQDYADTADERLMLTDDVMAATYERAENDSSTYSQTLRNAQGMLVGADQLIADIESAGAKLQRRSDDFMTPGASSRSPASARQNSTRSAHSVRFDDASAQTSGELPNYSHYRKYASHSDSAHASSEQDIDTVHAASNYVDAVDGSSGGGAREAARFAEGRGDVHDEAEDNADAARTADDDDAVVWDADDDDDDEHSEGEVIVAKPLNDVSSANFANYASVHEARGRATADAARTSGKHIYVAGGRPDGGGGQGAGLEEEQDSWFSVHATANLSRAELYDTINSEDGEAQQVDLNDAAVHVRGDAAVPTAVHARPADEASIHRTQPNGAGGDCNYDVTDAPRCVKSEVTRRDDGHLLNGSGDAPGLLLRAAHNHSDEEDVIEQRAPSEAQSSSEGEPMTQSNPLLMTQKTIRIQWTDEPTSIGKARGEPTSAAKSRRLPELAQRIDFDHGVSDGSAAESFAASEHAHDVDAASGDEADQSRRAHAYDDASDVSEPPADDDAPSLHSHRAPANANQQFDIETPSPYDVITDVKSHDTSTSSVKNVNGNNNGGGGGSCDVTGSTCTPRSDVTEASSAPRSDVSDNVSVPSFFPSSQQLTSTMRALQIASNVAKTNTQLEADRAEAKRDVMYRLSMAARLPTGGSGVVSARGRPLPPAEQTQRIAKIFQQQYKRS